MTDSEARVQELEGKYHDVDKRQESFETFTRENLKSIRQQQESFEQFMRTYIDINEKKIAQLDVRMDKLEAKLDSQFQHLTNQFHNTLIAGGVGVLTIIVTILATK